MSVIRWEVPPRAKRGGRNGQGELWRWSSVMDDLTARPGEWALVAEDIQFNTLILLRELGCETTARGVARNGRIAKAYARFIEEPGDDVRGKSYETPLIDTIGH